MRRKWRKPSKKWPNRLERSISPQVSVIKISPQVSVLLTRSNVHSRYRVCAAEDALRVPNYRGSQGGTHARQRRGTFHFPHARTNQLHRKCNFIRSRFPPHYHCKFSLTRSRDTSLNSWWQQGDGTANCRIFTSAAKFDKWPVQQAIRPTKE
jgi:hypothetical protein